ncbi:MAG: hypothetical protein J1E07_10075 [Treponema sp.]|nr:hypothetical protein [Treponema sp.]
MVISEDSFEHFGLHFSLRGFPDFSLRYHHKAMPIPEKIFTKKGGSQAAS